MFDNVSIAANQTSRSTVVEQLDKAGIVLEWTGSSPVGTVSVEGRLGNDQTATNTDWHALDFGSTISISGSSGSHTLVLEELPWTELRIKYTATSGTGNLTATLLSKDIGA